MKFKVLSLLFVVTFMACTNRRQTDYKVVAPKPDKSAPAPMAPPPVAYGTEDELVFNTEEYGTIQENDFRSAKALDPNQRIDCCLSGLEGPCILDWQQGGIKLILEASDICEYLVLFNPDMPHFAVEPVTNANDAFNLASQAIESGTKILRSGESLTATMSMTAVVSN